MGRLVQWGAGNIGRSFIGQVFARNGWSVTFIDIDRELVDLLNRTHSYVVRTVGEEKSEDLHVVGIDAVDGNDRQRVIESIVYADILSFSVGKHVLPRIAPLFAEALLSRWKVRGETPLDVILAENMHDGALLVRSLLEVHLPKEYPLSRLVGLIQTSIGKMVPIQESRDRLMMIAEPFNTLVLDRDGFLGAIPDFPQIEAVSPIEAYVDRKLYMHNLGHAVAAYVGYDAHPQTRYLAEVIGDERVLSATRSAMGEGADILLASYPEVFTPAMLTDYREDLLHRFSNRALGDTVHRVGRDLARKLRHDDRLMGAMLAAHRLGVSYDAVAHAYAKALSFASVDETGKLFEPDRKFLQAIAPLSPVDRICYAAGMSAGLLPQEIIATIAAQMHVR